MPTVEAKVRTFVILGIFADVAAGSGGANYSVMAAQATNAMFNDVLVKVNDSSRSGGNLTYAGWMINKWPNYWENNRTFLPEKRGKLLGIEVDVGDELKYTGDQLRDHEAHQKA